MLQIPKLNKYDLNFPNPNNASEDGIVAWGGDLNPSRLLSAYRNGIFPWYGKNEPILWWSPNPRFILELDDFKLHKSLKKNIKKFTFKIDSAFKEVMTHCASTYREGQNGTWINDEMIESYEVLHAMQKAHSIETYYNDELVGGLYGLSIANVFCGESMFSHKSDASKAALAVLVAHLKKWKYDFIDAQVPTQHLLSLGAKEVAREYYLNRLTCHKKENEVRWELDRDLIENL